MHGVLYLSSLFRLGGANWLGPHFYYDLIRLARKGWPTFARVLYLVVLLISLAVMYRAQGGNVRFTEPAEYARRAHSYAITLLVIQDLLVLALLPVYVASAIAEERENQTLESLSLTHLTDRELVLGKLFARLMHLGAIVLSSLPLLVFMHLWGNVDVELLIYHEVNTFLLLLSAGSLCILKSTYAESVFEAISGSYPWLALMAVFGVGGAFALPWIIGSFIFAATRFGSPTAMYLPGLPVLTIAHGIFIYIALLAAIGRMDSLRREERRKPRKQTGALSLSDNPQPEGKPGKRGQVRSKIHPWAWPIRDDAVFWKECIKDGTSWSLSCRWALFGLAFIALASAGYQVLIGPTQNDPERQRFIALPFSFTFSAYFVALAAYALVVIFQMTMSVAGEREHDTLGFLLMIPRERHEILFAKWLGPWWRNWPILAIAYFGVILGLGCRLYDFWGAILLITLPWPLMLMLGNLAFWLSVVCRRVLFANIALVGVMALLVIAHMALGEQSLSVLRFLAAMVYQRPLTNPAGATPWQEEGLLALFEQLLFLLVACLSILVAFRLFAKRDYAGT